MCTRLLDWSILFNARAEIPIRDKAHDDNHDDSGRDTELLSVIIYIVLYLEFFKKQKTLNGHLGSTSLGSPALEVAGLIRTKLWSVENSFLASDSL